MRKIGVATLTLRDASTHRPRARNSGWVDAMLFIAATAVGLAIAKAYFSEYVSMALLFARLAVEYW